MTEGILAEIVREKRKKAEAGRSQVPEERLRKTIGGLKPCRGFADALRLESSEGCLGVIAEVKRKSPSAGQISADPEFDLGGRVADYEGGGATCVSVLTDEERFAGSNADLETARKNCSIPVLRKDFTVDTWQVHESRAIGSDCILLIVAAIEDRKLLAELAAVAGELGMDVLVEVHAEDEVEPALDLGTGLVGVNNRDLSTFETDLAVSERLIPRLKGEGRVVVAESAIRTGADAARMKAAGADAVLVGEALMRANDVPALIDELRCQERT